MTIGLLLNSSEMKFREIMFGEIKDKVVTADKEEYIKEWGKVQMSSW